MCQVLLTKSDEHYHKVGFYFQFYSHIAPIYITNPFSTSEQLSLKEMRELYGEENIRSFFRNAKGVCEMQELMYDCFVRLLDCEYDEEGIREIADKHHISYEKAEEFANNMLSYSEFYEYLAETCPNLHSRVLVLPEGMKELEKEAFSDDCKISKVVIPRSMEKIEKNAFHGSLIDEVDFPSAFSTYCYFEEGVFTGCKFLKTVCMGEAVEFYDRERPFEDSEYIRDILAGNQPCPQEIFDYMETDEKSMIAAAVCRPEYQQTNGQKYPYLEQYLKDNIDSVIYDLFYHVFDSKLMLNGTLDNVKDYAFHECKPELESLKLMFDVMADKDNISEFMSEVIEMTNRTHSPELRLAMFDYQAQKNIYPDRLELL